MGVISSYSSKQWLLASVPYSFLSYTFQLAKSLLLLNPNNMIHSYITSPSFHVWIISCPLLLLIPLFPTAESCVLREGNCPPAPSPLTSSFWSLPRCNLGQHTFPKPTLLILIFCFHFTQALHKHDISQLLLFKFLDQVLVLIINSWAQWFVSLFAHSCISLLA